MSNLSLGTTYSNSRGSLVTATGKAGRGASGGGGVLPDIELTLPSIPVDVDWNLTSNQGGTLAIKNKPVIPSAQTLATVASTGKYTDLLNQPTFATVATSGKYTDLLSKPTRSTVAATGNYTDLLSKPTLSTVAATGNYTDLLSKPTLSTVAATGSYTDLLSKPTFSTVATSGNYTDLSNAPPQLGDVELQLQNVPTCVDWNLTSNQGSALAIINKPSTIGGAATDFYSIPSNPFTALLPGTNGTGVQLLSAVNVLCSGRVLANTLTATVSIEASNASKFVLPNTTTPIFATVASSGRYTDLIDAAPLCATITSTSSFSFPTTPAGWTFLFQSGYPTWSIAGSNVNLVSNPSGVSYFTVPAGVYFVSYTLQPGTWDGTTALNQGRIMRYNADRTVSDQFALAGGRYQNSITASATLTMGATDQLQLQFYTNIGQSQVIAAGGAVFQITRIAPMA
jgi:hypothetical protein